MKILGLILARGGSKGVPRKNARLLGSKPLVQYSIECGLASGLLDKIVVSTEDEEIAAISRSYGANVPFMRPAELATDESPTIDTVLHAVNYFKNIGEEFEAVCLLQPTVPFRSSSDVNNAINKFQRLKPDCLISVRKVPHAFNPHWIFEQPKGSEYLQRAIATEKLITRRQNLPTAYYRDGAIYITSVETLLTKNSLYGESILPYEMQDSPDINIDTMEDWKAAEAFLQIS